MTEPTIDQMLQFLDAAHSHLIASDSEFWVDQHYDGTLDRTVAAIRAILEQHREEIPYARMSIRRAEIVTIRAFVERVRWRVDETWRNAALVDQAMYTHAYVMAVEDELAAMEKESE